MQEEKNERRFYKNLATCRVLKIPFLIRHTRFGPAWLLHQQTIVGSSNYGLSKMSN